MTIGLVATGDIAHRDLQPFEPIPDVLRRLGELTDVPRAGLLDDDERHGEADPSDEAKQHLSRAEPFH
jgi:hypothetical protein